MNGPSRWELLDVNAPGAPGEVESALEPLRPGAGGPRIRCPLCGWRPRRSDRWGCSCGHAWNTFDTAGLCPACGYQWTVTQCLSCHGRSAHLAWYAPEPSAS